MGLEQVVLVDANGEGVEGDDELCGVTAVSDAR
jgi:hypothetical protein